MIPHQKTFFHGDFIRQRLPPPDDPVFGLSALRCNTVKIVVWRAWSVKQQWKVDSCVYIELPRLCTTAFSAFVVFGYCLISCIYPPFVHPSNTSLILSHLHSQCRDNLLPQIKNHIIGYLINIHHQHHSKPCKIECIRFLTSNIEYISFYQAGI